MNMKEASTIRFPKEKPTNSLEVSQNCFREEKYVLSNITWKNKIAYLMLKLKNVIQYF